jgi:hypothetical protein
VDRAAYPSSCFVNPPAAAASPPFFALGSGTETYVRSCPTGAAIRISPESLFEKLSPHASQRD